MVKHEGASYNQNAMWIDSCRVAVHKGMSCVILDFDRMVLELPHMPVLSVGFFVRYGQLLLRFFFASKRAVPLCQIDDHQLASLRAALHLRGDAACGGMC